MSKKFIEARGLTLKTSIGTTDTQMIISGAYGLDGAEFSSDDFGDGIYATIEPNTARAESMLLTFVSTASGDLTVGMTRGLIGKQPYGTGGIAYAHSAGSKIVFTNSAALFNELSVRDRAETISGAKTYTGSNTHQGTEAFTGVLNAGSASSVVVPSPTSDTQAARKDYVDDADEAVIAGYQAADATKADDASVVHDTGDETIGGVKTFTSSPVIPDAVNTDEPLTKGQFDIATQAAASDASASVKGAVYLDKDPDTPATPIAIGANSPIDSATADPVPANNAGKIVKLDTDGKVGLFAIGGERITQNIGETIMGGTTPFAVDIDGHIARPAVLDVTTNNAVNHTRNVGFIKEDIQIDTSDFVSGSLSELTSTTTGSITAAAGTDRVLVACVKTSTTTPASTATWNGISMTLEESIYADDSYDVSLAVFTLAIGTSASPEVNTFVTNVTGDISCVTIENVNQSSPSANTYSEAHTNGQISQTDSSDVDLLTNDTFGTRIGFMASTSGGAISKSIVSGTTIKNAASFVIVYNNGYEKEGKDNMDISIKTSSTTDSTAAISISLRSTSSSETATVYTTGEINGFTGLTPGSIYYAASTPGAISTTRKGKPIGFALSGTSLYVNSNFGDSRKKKAVLLNQSLVGTSGINVGFFPVKITFDYQSFIGTSVVAYTGVYDIYRDNGYLYTSHAKDNVGETTSISAIETKSDGSSPFTITPTETGFTTSSISSARTYEIITIEGY